MTNDDPNNVRNVELVYDGHAWLSDELPPEQLAKWIAGQRTCEQQRLRNASIDEMELDDE